MSDIISGFAQAINLIVTLNPDVSADCSCSLYSLPYRNNPCCLYLNTSWRTDPFPRFPGQRCAYRSHPDPLFCSYSRCRPPHLSPDLEEQTYGLFGLLWTPEGMILGQTVLIVP